MVHRIREVYQSKGLSREGLARLSGVRGTTIANYERGLANPSMDKIEAIAKALDVNPAYLMGWTDEIAEPVVKIVEQVEIVYDHRPARLPSYHNNDNDGKVIKWVDNSNPRLRARKDRHQKE